ncbi:hypothetical protein FQN49_002221 [Arthroderma sp. PD_2]|nr:hypothetical protein FQN49_002221 [Arthroderma sp. PD_2]
MSKKKPKNKGEQSQDARAPVTLQQPQKKSKNTATQLQDATLAVKVKNEGTEKTSKKDAQNKVTQPQNHKATAASQKSKNGTGSDTAPEKEPKNTASQAQNTTVAAAPRNLRNEIRKDVRAMYKGEISISQEEIQSRYLRLYPEKAQYISSVLNDYAASLEKNKLVPGPPQVKGKEKEKQGAGLQNRTLEIKAKGQPNSSNLQNCPFLPSASGQVAKGPVKSNGIYQEQTKTAILHEFTKYFTSSNDSCNNQTIPPPPLPKIPALEKQVQFLNLSDDKNQSTDDQPPLYPHEAVLLSPVLESLSYKLPPQFALLGHQPSKRSAAFDPRVMLNTNIPFSAFICGLQGSGKSHTTACMIENCTLSLPALGPLNQPLSTLVLNFNEYSSNSSSQPSEAAFLASVMPEYRSSQSRIPVTVLVSPSNFHNLENMYSRIPGIQVRPFQLQPKHLNISSMFSLMSLGKRDSMPLYMVQVTKVLREMAMSTKGPFDYLDFRARLDSLHLDRTQTCFLDQRLDLLDSFLDVKGDAGESCFVDHGVTILDLSCPFVDQGTACTLFRIAIDIFLHTYSSRGKMIVADEAHKYITDTPAAKELTDTFLNIIRQQRHLGARLILSTQEPTISPRLIDLCSMTIIHRFSSPDWYNVIRKHVTIGDIQGNSRSAYGEGDEDGLYQISSLRTGEAFVFAPSAFLLDGNKAQIDTKHKVFKLAIRKRITWDGGQTILCV